MKWLEWPHLWTQKAQLHSSRGICDHCRRVQNAETVPRPSPAVGTVPKCFIFFARPPWRGVIKVVTNDATKMWSVPWLSQAFSKCTRRGCQWPRRPRQEAKEDGGAIAFKSWAFETIHVHHLLSFLIMFLPCLFREIFRVEVRKLSSWLIATHTTGVLSLVCFVWQAAVTRATSPQGAWSQLCATACRHTRHHGLCRRNRNGSWKSLEYIVVQ